MKISIWRTTPGLWAYLIQYKNLEIVGDEPTRRGAWERVKDAGIHLAEVSA